MKNKWLIPFLFILFGALGGCYNMTIVSGSPANFTPPAFQAHWHHGVINGVIEVDGDYNLDQLCPNGWADIHTRTGILNSIVTALTGHIYTPQTVSVSCTQ